MTGRVRKALPTLPTASQVRNLTAKEAAALVKAPAVVVTKPGQRSGFMYTDAVIPVAARGETTENPHAEAVRHLVGTEKAKSFVVVEHETKKHINWLRDAGKLANVTVRTHLAREDGSEVKADTLKTDEKATDHVVITFWTRDRITRARKTDDVKDDAADVKDADDSDETDESDADEINDDDRADEKHEDEKADTAVSGVTARKATPAKKVTLPSK